MQQPEPVHRVGQCTSYCGGGRKKPCGRQPACRHTDTVSVLAENRSDYLVLSWVLRPGFFVSNTLTSILPHTAYLDNTLLAASRGLPIGTVTAVGTITRNVLENDTVYDLQGRRVTAPVHGIFIINGRKVFVK